MQIPATGASPFAAPASQSSAGLTPAKTKGDAAVQDFMAYANMTPAQKMRAAILGSMGLSEDSLKAMDPKEREKVEAEIKDLIQRKIEQSVEKKNGLMIDLKA